MIFLNSFQTNLLIAQNQLSGTNACITSAYISLSTASDPAVRANIESHITQLQETQSHQKQIVSDATQQVLRQQSLLTRTPGQVFPPIQLPPPPGLPPPQHAITPSSPSTSPPIPRTNLKHGRTEDVPTEPTGGDERQAQRIRVHSQPDDEQDIRDEMAIDKDINVTK
ncbi:hypothetical protein H0H92_010876 [Tricholoma furcatifolium]|nr:hypothetical protein H0H92_010876 [Tricholoma furcatifolium]